MISSQLQRTKRGKGHSNRLTDLLVLKIPSDELQGDWCVSKLLGRIVVIVVLVILVHRSISFLDRVGRGIDSRDRERQGRIVEKIPLAGVAQISTCTQCGRWAGSHRAEDNVDQTFYISIRIFARSCLVPYYISSVKVICENGTKLEADCVHMSPYIFHVPLSNARRHEYSDPAQMGSL